jgi:hypothetical protein
MARDRCRRDCGSHQKLLHLSNLSNRKRAVIGIRDEGRLCGLVGRKFRSGRGEPQRALKRRPFSSTLFLPQGRKMMVWLGSFIDRIGHFVDSASQLPDVWQVRAVFGLLSGGGLHERQMAPFHLGSVVLQVGEQVAVGVGGHHHGRMPEEPLRLLQAEPFGQEPRGEEVA